MVSLWLEALLAVLYLISLAILPIALLLGAAIVESLFRSRVERIALAQFKRDYPDVRPGWTGRRRDGELHIVMVAYGHRRPPLRKYYAVEPVTSMAKVVEDDSKYRPKIDR